MDSYKLTRKGPHQDMNREHLDFYNFGVNKTIPLVLYTKLAFTVLTCMGYYTLSNICEKSWSNLSESFVVRVGS